MKVNLFQLSSQALTQHLVGVAKSLMSKANADNAFDTPHQIIELKEADRHVDTDKPAIVFDIAGPSGAWAWCPVERRVYSGAKTRMLFEKMSVLRKGLSRTLSPRSSLYDVDLACGRVLEDFEQMLRSALRRYTVVWLGSPGFIIGTDRTGRLIISVTGGIAASKVTATKKELDRWRVRAGKVAF